MTFKKKSSYKRGTPAQCKHPDHSCEMGCNEMGGLSYGDSFNSSGNENVFVCFVYVKPITREETGGPNLRWQP